jgi:multiple sugar transport system permease protein/raffinose/stachyose/melibiose transport system permease protein
MPFAHDSTAPSPPPPSGLAARVSLPDAFRLGTRGALFVLLLLYTAYAIGPLVWLGALSLRTTAEIDLAHYAMPEQAHWWKFSKAWIESNYSGYFWNSTVVVCSAVAALVLIGSMAAFCLARYRFKGNRLIFFAIFSTIMLPPQITVISLFQILVQYRLFDSLLGLTLVYIGIQLPISLYILEGFFRKIPEDLFDAARMDGYGDFEIYWRIGLPIAMPGIVAVMILNFILLWNEFLYAVVLITSDGKRTLPLGVQKFIGDQFSDIGMVATGAMISIIPVLVAYALFSEKVIQGMTAGAVK